MVYVFVAHVLSSLKKVLQTVVNWSPTLLIHGLKLLLQFDCSFSTATLASGGPVTVGKDAGRTSLTFDLGVGDAVILRV